MVFYLQFKFKLWWLLGQVYFYNSHKQHASELVIVRLNWHFCVLETQETHTVKRTTSTDFHLHIPVFLTPLLGYQNHLSWWMIDLSFKLSGDSGPLIEAFPPQNGLQFW